MAEFVKVTEQESHYHDLEKMSISELLVAMNTEDQGVPLAVAKAIPQIEKLVAAIYPKMERGGRLFYLGAGTSGRLGVLDASEIPPTYDMPHGLIVGLMAGGEVAIRKSVEAAEDSLVAGWEELSQLNVNTNDVVVGIAASGTTPYVIGALTACRGKGITTGCITCNLGTPLSAQADFPVEAVVGPEFVTGSTRMKSGTAQKLILNMISTSLMIRMGRVKDNRMVNMQLTNTKLLDRGTKMVMHLSGITDYEQARQLLVQYGSVKKAVDAYPKP
jgi:N-acetylmuramic acid 6-phosphate etherase